MSRKSKEGASRKPPSRPAKLPFWKKALFALVTSAAFFLLLELVLALSGIRPVLYQEDPYVSFATNVPLFVEERQEDGSIDMVSAPNKLRWFNRQRFSRRKPGRAFRIFSVGGSTTYGRPYDDTASFSGWLREFLPVADPTHHWEVINAGGISYASYRVAVLMEELAEYDPDLFIIYSGHNEFLEDRTYRTLIETPQVITGMAAVMSRTRIYAAVQKISTALARRPSAPEKGQAVLASEVDPILEHSVGPSDYTRDDSQRQRVIAHYRFNLNRMIEIARSAGAEVVLITPASNLLDCSPFKSEHREGLSAADRRRFDELYARAEKARRAGDLEEALSHLEEAAAIDDRYAEIHYWSGLALFGLERYEEAKAALERAVDEDVCPLRALTPMQQIVREVAAQWDVPLVDFTAILEDVSEHHIPGAGLFLDHVHLTIDGYQRLALEIMHTLAKESVVRITDQWNEQAKERVTKLVKSRVDQRDHGVALRNLAKVFAWAGKLEEAERMASEATRILGDDAESLHAIGLSAFERGEFDTAIANYKEALRIKPDFARVHNSLGIALVSQGKLDRAIDHFRRAVSMHPEFAEAHYNLGNALESLGHLAEAVDHFRRALEFEPDFADARNNLAIALVAAGKQDEAIRHFRLALELTPDSAETLHNLGVALASEGRFEEAATCFGRVVELDPDFAEAHYYLGLTLGSQHRLEEAVAHFRKALDANPAYAEAHYQLANALVMKGERDQALTHFEEALALASDGNSPELVEAVRKRLERFRQETSHQQSSSSEPATRHRL